MKVLLTGGGSGGHFYPIIAVAEKLNQLAQDEKLINLELIYMSNSPYDMRALEDNRIKFVKLNTGKMRLYFSLMNFVDIFKTFFAIFKAIWKIYKIFPDVIFSKGGYPAVPVVIAGNILGIPIIIHESDSYPGRANKMARKIAKRIAISYKEAGDYFDPEKTAFVGNIIRKEVREPITEGAFEFLKLDPTKPTVLVLGGSQGAKMINDTLVEALPTLLDSVQVIHQTGTKNFDEVSKIASVTIKEHPHRDNYRPFPYLNKLALRMSAGAADLIITRAGAASLAEAASWGVPSIVIPIKNSNGDHQRKNAYNYAETGSCVVIEETNLTPSVLVSEVERLIKDKTLLEKMKEGTKSFVHPDAETKVAQEIINLALEHQK